MLNYPPILIIFLFISSLTYNMPKSEGDASKTDTSPETEADKGATASEVSEKEWKNLYATLEKMKIKPDSFTSWLASQEDQPQAKKELKFPTTQAPTLPPPLPTGSYYKAPLRISVFSGDEKDSYELWKYEVVCLMKESHSEESILQAIRRSVKGEAAKVIMRLGVGVSVQEILCKLDSIYGNVLEKEDILAEFYSAKQKDDETCSAWSCRLEDILCKAMKMGKVQNSAANEMLRTMFYKGLRHDLKDICGHLYHSINDFDKLRVEIRKIETEHPAQGKVKSKPAIAKAGVSQPETTSTLDSKFEALQAQINQLRTTQESYYNPPSYGSRNFRGKQPYQRGRRQFSGRGRVYTPRMPEPRVSDVDQGQQMPRRSGSVVCYKCGQEGHIAVGCRVRVDHRRNLNYRWPNPGDKGLADNTVVPPARK
ncbi:paraneoplastic antigen Ma3 homolog [Saccostrea cucullata]|uniref:paraneoplastic antigen Ma3 homolog n=1 Tax=Saccostrea cuccullata TaxID=36930 RepID=UPI002ED31C78